MPPLRKRALPDHCASLRAHPLRFVTPELCWDGFLLVDAQGSPVMGGVGRSTREESIGGNGMLTISSLVLIRPLAISSLSAKFFYFNRLTLNSFGRQIASTIAT